MARGGKRTGAGRKIGATTKKTREIADKAINEGVSPLEVILEAMRGARARGDTEKAVSYAGLAAPYMHPRLVAKQNDSGEVGHDKLVEILQAGRRRHNEYLKKLEADKLKLQQDGEV